MQIALDRGCNLHLFSLHQPTTTGADRWEGQMAFTDRNLTTFAYSNGATLWRYATTDSAAEVLAPGYFNQSHWTLRSGDFLYVTLVSGARVTGGHLFVSEVAGGVVTVGVPDAFASVAQMDSAAHTVRAITPTVAA